MKSPTQVASQILLLKRISPPKRSAAIFSRLRHHGKRLCSERRAMLFSGRLLMFKCYHLGVRTNICSPRMRPGVKVCRAQPSRECKLRRTGNG